MLFLPLQFNTIIMDLVTLKKIILKLKIKLEPFFQMLHLFDLIFKIRLNCSPTTILEKTS
jgi:hypothetical protein